MTHSDVNDMTWLSQLWMTWLDSLVLRDSFISDVKKLYLTWLIHEWHDSCISDVTHSYLTWLIHIWRDSFICDVTHSYLTWLIHIWRDSFMSDVPHAYLTWLIRLLHIRDMTHSYMARLNCVRWLIHIGRDICDVTDAHPVFVTWLIRMWLQRSFIGTLQRTATYYCNILLQHTATHCNTLQHTATHCNTLQHTATHCRALSLVAWFRARLNIQVWMRHTHMGSHVPYEWVMPSWPVLGRG